MKPWAWVALGTGLAAGWWLVTSYQLDRRSELIVAGLAPEMATKARELARRAAAVGIPITFTSGARSLAEQARLYAQGRTTPGAIVTNTRESAHNYGAAVDVAFTRFGRYTTPSHDQPWEKLAAIGKKLDLVWGGDFTSIVDKPHFELRDWRTLRPVV